MPSFYLKEICRDAISIGRVLNRLKMIAKELEANGESEICPFPYELVDVRSPYTVFEGKSKCAQTCGRLFPSLLTILSFVPAIDSNLIEVYNCPCNSKLSTKYIRKMVLEMIRINSKAPWI